MRKELALTAFILTLLISGCINEVRKDANQVCIRGSCFGVEIADTPESRTLGLMGRGGLEEGRGMLFVFDEGWNHSFWMRDMHFPIDIVWISADMDVVHVSSYAQPCEPLEPCPSITPPGKAMYVLEVGAGEAYGFEAGDKVVFDLE